MPRPSARAAFGISQRPYQHHFPSQSYERTIPSEAELRDRFLRSSPFAATFAAHDPYGEQDAIDAGQAQAALDNFDPENPEHITGLQRMVGRGSLDPRKASAMISMADRIERQRMAQQALDIRRLQAEARAAAPSRADAAKLQKGYSEFSQEIGDEEKREAFKKKTGGQIETDADWKRAWHMVNQPRQSKFLADMDSIEMMGGVIPPNLAQIRDRIRGGQQAAPQAAPSQSTEVLDSTTLTREQVMALPSGTPIRMPDGSIKRKK